MAIRKNASTPCVIRESAINYAKRAGLIGECATELEECRIIDSVRKLLALGLSTQEIEDLDIRQPMLRAVCEFARLDAADSQDSGKAAEAVKTTLRVISDQMRNLDMEIEMLNLRRDALQRRTHVLEKLAAALGG